MCSQCRFVMHNDDSCNFVHSDAVQRFSPSHMQGRCAKLHVMLLQDAYVRNPVLKSGLIFIIRFGNTFWGGAQWVQYAKLIGIQ